MQISQVSPQTNPLGNFYTAQTIVNKNFQSITNELNINYSDSNNNVILSISGSSAYIESTYTKEGVLKDLIPDNNENVSILPQENYVIDKQIPELDSGISEMIDTAMEKYYKLLTKFVEYLLNTISEQRDQNLNSTNTGQNENLQDVNNGASAQTYTVYSQQTLAISQKITIVKNITDYDYFSPEKTAERIVNFALSFYDGSDRQEFAAKVRKAVMKGYYEAMKALGGFLPQEAHETIAIVNRAIDDFASGEDINISA